MHDSNHSEALTEQMETSAAETRELPRVLTDIRAQKKEEAFRAGQKKVLEMIATGAPLGEILTSLVLLIEAQSPEMLCSVLLLSNDGDHIVHGAAPSLPEEYVKAIDGAPIGSAKDHTCFSIHQSQRGRFPGGESCRSGGGELG
jgi:hypothetical protein